MNPSSILCAAVLLLPAPAQWLHPDQRVRVTAPHLELRRQEGRLLSLDRDSLVLTGSTRHWVVPRHLLTQVDSLRGVRGHALVGLATGAAVGFVVGAMMFTPHTTACTGSGNYAKDCRLYRAGIVVGGAGLGALVGALIRSEQWAPVALDSLR
jgi:hypothetical protein